MILTAQNLINIITIVGTFSLVSGVALFIYHVAKREKQLIETEKKAFSHYREIVDKANKQAAEILDKATTVSGQLLLQTKNTNQDIAVDLDKIMQQMAEKHIKSLAGEVVTFRKEYENKIMQMHQAIDQNTKFVIQNTQYNLNKNLEAFSKSMLDKTSMTSQMIDEKTKELLIQAEKDIEAYKQAGIEKIDKAIMLLVQKTYQNLLGENIPPEINRDMIIKALEKSKKEGLFDI